MKVYRPYFGGNPSQIIFGSLPVPVIPILVLDDIIPGRTGYRVQKIT